MSGDILLGHNWESPSDIEEQRPGNATKHAKMYRIVPHNRELCDPKYKVLQLRNPGFPKRTVTAEFQQAECGSTS